MAIWIRRLLSIIVVAAIISLPGSIGYAEDDEGEEISGESYDEVETVEVEETLPAEGDDEVEIVEVEETLPAEGDDEEIVEEVTEIYEETPVSGAADTVTSSTVHTSTTYVRDTSPTVADTVIIGAVAGSAAASAAKDAAKKSKTPEKKVIKKVKTKKADITVEVKPIADEETKK